MAKICESCNHSNPNSAHYCVNCGHPLEKERFNSRKNKKYVVVAESDYEYYKRQVERLSEENAQLASTWYNKLSRWFHKIDWESVWLVLFFVGCILVTIIICLIPWGSCSGGKDTLQIQLDKTTGKYGIYNNKEEKWITQAAFDSIISVKNTDNNYFILCNNGKYGVADSSGSLSVQCDLDSLGYMTYNGVKITYSNRKEGLIETCSGNQILPSKFYRVLWVNKPKHSGYESFVGNIIPVLETDNLWRWTLYNRQGKRIDTVTYYAAEQVNNPNLIRVKKYVKCPGNTGLYISGKFSRTCPSDWGIINTGGTVVFQFQYKFLYDVMEDCIWGRKEWNEPCCCYSINGTKIFTLSSKDMIPEYYHEGLAPVRYNGFYGFYNKFGDLVIPFKYQKYRTGNNTVRDIYFYNGKAYVSYNGKNGTIDKNGVFTPEK